MKMNQTKINEENFRVVKNLKTFILNTEFNISDCDFICPVLFELRENHPYVDKLYCDSFAHGKGCKDKNICESYQNEK